MKQVKFKKYIPIQHEEPNEKGIRHQIVGTAMYEKEFIHEGIFHQWGLAIVEADQIASYTVGIIENPDGTIEEVLPYHIQFIKTEPNKKCENLVDDNNGFMSSDELAKKLGL